MRSQEELYQHLVLCSKGSAAGDWCVEGMWPFMDDLYGMEEDTIRLKCKDAYQALDAIKKEGKVPVNNTYEMKIRTHRSCKWTCHL